ncbi:MBL fold metallo-hydrolase [Idiomarina sp. HP20-50]|uniref:MBL fold metallo-hydrolase n=1 Tax=Idiomarina sp. HP20-50 TaxID=3070813 RepID=UPI00294AEB83|nr:MBL fold metallo-hydrolase [Idiomarina sp. HP20-50]MDV6317050.1 MBL fold metallo-hydrolase [Idiomarina sp. HP20-50]
MKFTQIRNATIKLNFAGKTFLIDPMLAEKDRYPGFEGTLNSHLRNPTVELPLTLCEILDVDAVIVTHTHPDHWDEVAVQKIPKDTLIFVQHEGDANVLEKQGFTNLRILTEDTEFEGVTLHKAPGQHGSDVTLSLAKDVLGEVCGVVFKHDDEKTLYLAGDTIWNTYVEDSLKKYTPEIVILNAGDAQIPQLGSIIMDKEDVYRVHQVAPEATLIASHMESVNHAALSRVELRRFLTEKGIINSVLVPDDGESYSF